MKNVTEKELHDLYVVQGKSTREIIELTGLDRKNIESKRRRWGIKIPPTIIDRVRIVAGNWLTLNGFSHENVREKDVRSTYDYLVEGNVRLQVLSSKYDEGKRRYRFTFSQSARKGVKPNDYQIEVRGRIRKLYRKTCDVILFVGVKPDSFEFWCVPSTFIDDELTHLSLRPLDQNEDSPFDAFYDAADVIDEMNKRKQNRLD